MNMVKKIVVIIPSYKNEKWCQKNILSALSQDYENYNIIYIDDCSPDKTSEIVQKVIKDQGADKKVKFIKNSVRCGAMKNIYDAVHSCDDEDIIVTLDGDDFFSHTKVLQRISEEYNKDIWVSYGSYQDVPNKTRGCCRPYEKNIIDNNLFRYAQWRASHPRTFKAWLFKKIPKEDFYDPQGNWLDMAWDLSFMIPLLEMSGDKHSYINDILYDYNNENPISDHVVNQRRQGFLDGWIRSKPKYSKIK